MLMPEALRGVLKELRCRGHHRSKCFKNALFGTTLSITGSCELFFLVSKCIAVQTQPAVGYTSGDLCAYHQFLDQTDMPRWQPDNPSAPSRQYTHLLAQPRVGSRSCRLLSVACFETD